MQRTSEARERDLRGMGITPRERAIHLWSRGVDAVELHDAGWLRSRYWDDGLTLRAIALELGCSAWRVGQAMDGHDIPRRPRGPKR